MESEDKIWSERSFCGGKLLLLCFNFSSQSRNLNPAPHYGPNLPVSSDHRYTTITNCVSAFGGEQTSVVIILLCFKRQEIMLEMRKTFILVLPSLWKARCHTACHVLTGDVSCQFVNIFSEWRHPASNLSLWCTSSVHTHNLINIVTKCAIYKLEAFNIWKWGWPFFY